MLTISNQAVSFLKATKIAMGAPPDAGVRIQRGAESQDGTTDVRLAIREEPASTDESFEQNGLRIFIEESLMEPLDGRTLDVSEDSSEPTLFFH